MGLGPTGPLVAPEDGFLLFPRFTNVTAGDALFHYCTPIRSEQLDLDKLPRSESLTSAVIDQ